MCKSAWKPPLVSTGWRYKASLHSTCEDSAQMENEHVVHSATEPNILHIV